MNTRANGKLGCLEYLESLSHDDESILETWTRCEMLLLMCNETGNASEQINRNNTGNPVSNFSAAGMNRKRLNWGEWVETLSDYQFRVFYRMTRRSFYYLLSLIRPSLMRNEVQGRRGCPNGAISPEVQLSMGLRWLAGGSYLDIHHFHGVSQTAFFYAKNNVLLSIRNCLKLQIVFPSLTDISRLSVISKGFKHKSTRGVFDKCIGAVDGILIQLHSVKGEESNRASRYWSRKSFFAFNVQAVCDANRKFLWYSVENPGSTHDSMAFSRGNLAAALARDGRNIGNGMYIVGDAAYKGIPGIITPFDGSKLPIWQDSYNFHQSQLRINIECAFGMLTNRWECSGVDYAQTHWKLQALL